MTRYQKEAIAFSLLPFAAATLYYLLNNEKHLIEDFHDAYYVVNSIYIALGVLITTGYVCYLIRCCFLKFRDKASNTILLIYNTLFIILWTVLIVLNKRFSIEEGWTIYPPLSAASPQKIENSYFIMKPVYMFILLGLFIISLAFSAFKTGKKFNRINNEK